MIINTKLEEKNKNILWLIFLWNFMKKSLL